MSLDAYLTLGRSGLRVSPLTLGTMTFGNDHGWGASPEESANMLAAYLDRGGNSVDTANLYTNGHAEKIIGDYLAGHGSVREQIVLGTKFFGNLHRGDPNGGGVGRKGIIRQLENSLRRLRTDYVDLYWVHNYDPTVPLAETLRTLDDLVTAGKIRYVGLSDMPAWELARAATIAEFRGWAPMTALQLEYSLLERTGEGELIPAARALGVGVLPWAPLKNGFLSGKYGSGNPVPVDSARATTTAVFRLPTEAEYPVIDAVNAIAAELGVSVAAVALSWVTHRPGIGSTIIGARTLAQLEANLSAVDVALTEGQRTKLDELSEPTLAFPAGPNQAAPMLQFGGMTVDGRDIPLFPVFAGEHTTY